MMVTMDDINNPPKVSVVIPLYNKAPYIARALDSVFAQIVQDFEIIVVGGRSNDNGEKIVKQYHDSRIYLIEERGRGVSEARNQGVDAARAELIAFLDADDEWLPQFLETILKLREKYPEAGIYATGYERLSNNGWRKECVLPVSQDLIIADYFAERKNGGILIISTSSMAIPKSIFIMMGGFPIGVVRGEDNALKSKIALYNPIAYSPIIGSRYYVNTINNSNSYTCYYEDVFSEYVSMTSDWRRSNKPSEVIAFCDKTKLIVSFRNLMNGHDHQRIRSYLYTIVTPEYRVQKYIYIILSYLPNYIIYAIKILLKNIYSLIRQDFKIPGYRKDNQL